ncbi:MAG TPA: hypothetical protein PKO06_08445 [Candidatus Ozemobacteraceae bacterium]|nr:hypothetical protein [Candidatus Ozemobacteraceae bacterium]
MNDKITLPPQVQEEISLYLAGDEEILEAIPSTTGSVGKLGELWMLLTDRNVLFYTCEHNKDPVVALIGRKDLQSISYEIHPSGVTLTFVSMHRPQHPTRIAFLRAQRPLVNRFCEKLSKDVAFEVIGADEKPEAKTTTSPRVSGMRPVMEETGAAATKPGAAVASVTPTAPSGDKPSAPVSEPNVSVEIWSGDLGKGVPSGTPEHPAGATNKAVSERVVEVIPPPPSRPPEVRIATSITAKPAQSQGTLKTGLGGTTTKAGEGKPPVLPASERQEPARPKVADRPAQTQAETSHKPSAESMARVTRPTEAPRVGTPTATAAETNFSEVRFVVFSTLIALVVGFIWYRLFEAIGDTRPRR